MHRKYWSSLVLGFSLLLLPVGAKEKKAQPSAASVAKGKELFQQCAGCHNVDNGEKKMGPSLKGLYSKKTLSSNGKPVTDANVLHVINVGGKGMPAYGNMLSPAEKKDLLAYLKTL
jgi:cytochrome c